MQNLDNIIFAKINWLAGYSPLLDKIGIFFAVYAGYFLIAIVLGIAIYKRGPRNIRMAVESALAIILARGIVVEAIRFFYHRLRPFHVVDAFYLISEKDSWSFPSGHATMYFALAMSVYFFNKKLGKVFLVVAALISLARVFVGVHWPSDIVAGAALGILSAYVVHWALKKFFPNLLPYEES